MLNVVKNKEICPLDIAFNFLNLMHTTWPIHKHYFCNETSLSILCNKKIDKFIIITSALPEYLEKKFKSIIFNHTQYKRLHTFKLLWNNLQITILCVDEYPWLEMYKENYIHFNAELLFIDWESQIYDPYKVESELLKNKQLKTFFIEDCQNAQELIDKYQKILE